MYQNVKQNNFPWTIYLGGAVIALKPRFNLRVHVFSAQECPAIGFYSKQKPASYQVFAFKNRRLKKTILV